MPFPGATRNRKITDLFIPAKKERLNAKASALTTQLDRSKPPIADQFISPKRRRRPQSGKKEELDKLFDKISDDPFYENIVPTFSKENNFERDTLPNKQDLNNSRRFATADQQLDWIYGNYPSDSDGNSSTPTADDLAKMADEFLEEELTEQLKQALESTDLQDDGVISYRFFSQSCKLPNPSLQLEYIEMMDKSTKTKYNHIIKYSQGEEERHFLLSSGQLPLWHRLGWQCPHLVLQWLIEVVAFDRNIGTAKLAMSTISSLWCGVLRKNAPLRPLTGDGINYDQKFSMETLAYILTSYGALNLPVTDDMTTTTTSKKNGDELVMTENGSTVDNRVPLTQLEWVLDLLKISLTLWPDDYTTSQLHYLANVLFCIGMDGIGVLVLKHIQDALEACLRAMPGDDLGWKTQVQRLAMSLCERQFITVGLQVRLPTIAKPTCDRCLYLRRVIALIALELALEKDQQETITTSSANAVTPPPPMESSQGKLQRLSLFLASDGGSILPRLATIVNDPRSVFQQTDPQYRDYSDRVCLLDYAIGNNYTEFMDAIDTIHSLVTQLQASSRKIGGRLGTLEKTKANEVTQRLWSRLAYVIGRNGNIVEDIEF